MKNILATIATLLLTGFTLSAQTPADSTAQQGPTILPPLFEYPTAPEDSTMDWTARSNWLVEHFWDNFDPNGKAAPQVQIDHAFRTFVVPMRFADRDVALKSVGRLLESTKKNSTLTMQLVKAAEHSVYNPETAEVLVDELYVRMLRAMLADKKIPDLRKVRYAAQLQSLENCMTGMQMPAFAYTTSAGSNGKFTTAPVPTIIEFGDYDCSDCRLTRLRLETDSELQKLVQEGKARIFFISPDIPEDDVAAWTEGVQDYPGAWTVGRAEGLEDELDLRTTPCIYLLNPEGAIVKKNATSNEARAYVRNLCSASNSTAN